MIFYNYIQNKVNSFLKNLKNDKVIMNEIGYEYDQAYRLIAMNNV